MESEAQGRLFPPQGSEGAGIGQTSLVIGEIELLLAEKRTALAVLRTAIALLALPLSIISMLIVTSKHYSAAAALPWLVPISAVNIVLLGSGFYLLVRSMMRIHALDGRIGDLKRQFSDIANLIE